MSKDLEKLVRESDKIGVRLKDEKFTGRAPADVVERERERYGEMMDKRRRIASILEDLE